MWILQRLRCRQWMTIASVLCMALSAPAQDSGLEPVTLQLKWTHQFQFAGYYLALERGFYREAGLDVRIVEGGPAVNVAEEVVSGRADFGVGTSELLLDYAAGKPVVVLGVIYQHSPQALATRSDLGVRTLAELRGRNIMMEESASDLLTMLRMEGVTVDQFTIVPHNVNPDAWNDSSVAAVSTYTSDEPFLMDRSGVEYRLFYPQSYGIDFYGDNFFTRADIAGNRPELARAFREATIRGWEEARRDPYAAIDLIERTYPHMKSRAHLVYEANKTIELMTNLVRPGHMERERWEAILDTYIASGMLETAPPLGPFLFEHAPSLLPPWFAQALAGTITIFALLGGLAAYLHALNRRLSGEIARREVIEADLRHSHDELRQALSEVKTLKSILPICSYCKKIRDNTGRWEPLERYISTHGGADFSHGVCPECMRVHYPEHADGEST